MYTSTSMSCVSITCRGMASCSHDELDVLVKLISDVRQRANPRLVHEELQKRLVESAHAGEEEGGTAFTLSETTTLHKSTNMARPMPFPVLPQSMQTHAISLRPHLQCWIYKQASLVPSNR